jgi:hypothetical protein
MSSTSLSNATFAIGESPWLIRDGDGNVITHIDFSNVDPASVNHVDLVLEYRGLSPIKVLGFYLINLPPTIYGGSQSSSVDAAEVIRWGDDYVSELGETGTPGLSIQYRDFQSGNLIFLPFKSGAGDSQNSPIPYSGHRNSIVDIDQQIRISLVLVTPNAENKEITQTATYSFGMDIDYIEIPERLQDSLVDSEI